MIKIIENKKNTKAPKAKRLSVESSSSLSLGEKIAPNNGIFFLDAMAVKHIPEIRPHIIAKTSLMLICPKRAQPLFS
ncbi:MAG TPA: hypothetical protein VFF54_00675 [Thermodesulfobacteriota bacterium]|nr:hypothetical protein [Thermodesulfobacteriota bacterium]